LYFRAGNVNSGVFWAQ